MVVANYSVLPKKYNGSYIGCFPYHSASFGPASLKQVKLPLCFQCNSCTIFFAVCTTCITVLIAKKIRSHKLIFKEKKRDNIYQLISKIEKDHWKGSNFK
jgi:hypothetical protein